MRFPVFVVRGLPGRPGFSQPGLCSSQGDFGCGHGITGRSRLGVRRFILDGYPLEFFFSFQNARPTGRVSNPHDASALGDRDARLASARRLDPIEQGIHPGCARTRYPNALQ